MSNRKNRNANVETIVPVETVVNPVETATESAFIAESESRGAETIVPVETESAALETATEETSAETEPMPTLSAWMNDTANRQRFPQAYIRLREYAFAYRDKLLSAADMEDSPLATDKAILVALAAHANTNGFSFNPTVQTSLAYAFISATESGINQKDLSGAKKFSFGGLLGAAMRCGAIKWNGDTRDNLLRNPFHAGMLRRYGSPHHYAMPEGMQPAIFMAQFGHKGSNGRGASNSAYSEADSK